MVAGDLARVEDAFVTGSGRRVSLHAYVMPGQEDRLGPALTALKKAMQWDEANYGREYDLDLFMLVAVPDFNMGAMENKGLNIFNAQYVLADPESATDRDLENIEAVVAHEYFHNWTGNRVTCRDWFQLCLKEGLTVFREQQFVADQGAPAVARLREVKTLRALQFPEDEGPMAHPVRPSTYLEINNFYTPTVYEKGAELIRMLHTLIGAEAFRAGMDLYFQRYDGKAVTVEDLLAVMAEASRRDLGQFQRWYEQAGTPRVRITRDEEDGRLRLTAEQSIPAAAGQAQGLPLLIPVRLGLIGPDGEVIVPRPQGGGRIEGDEMIWELTQPRQTLVLHGVPRGAVVSVFRRFSAPVRVETDLERSEWIHLLRHDSDDFNRLEAAQTILMELVWAAAEGAMPDETALQALGALLDESDLQPAVIAEALSLPAFDFLAASVQALDPIALARARLALCAVLGERLRDRLRRRYDELAGVDEPGARALRRLALAMLAESDPDGTCTLAEAQFDQARHMTEILSALELLVAHDPVRAERALKTFYERWKGDDLAVDKWFRVQALAWRDDPVERVEALLTHRAFELRRPNRVRSLLGAFAGGNPFGFHASDGSGYRLLAEQIEALMKINPQMAARLTTLLAPWRRMAEPWRSAMREQLEKLAHCAPPKDVYEVLSRSLASPSADAGC
jgi:aminopeptidase N